MNPITTLPLPDGVRVVVPDSIDLMTTYVLREQQDWFEDEVRFLRRLMKPGQKAIDIGANYGVYALSIARAVGPGGAVWAFEPAAETAALLAQSVAANGFAHVTIDRSAVSNQAGSAQLSLNRNSELNALVRGQASHGASETVPLVTLDERLAFYGWADIDLLKIDAEGEEANILKGGAEFFKQLSPLVQYEVKVGEGFQMSLVQAFADLGYQSYRLVPALDLLVPVSPADTPDAYLLNLFCCKPDRAAKLAQQGFLLQAFNHATTGKADKRHGWQETVAQLPYGRQLAKLWKKSAPETDFAEVEQALVLYARSRDTSLPAAERFSALESSFARMTGLGSRSKINLRLASTARIAHDLGARWVAVSALTELSARILESGEVGLNEPFLAPGERFDFVAPAASLGDWVLAAVLEQLELLAAHSSFHTGEGCRGRLDFITRLGLGSEAMERRLALLQQRFP